MASPVALCSLAGAAIILTLVAPYDTDDLLRLVPRFIYWAATVGLTYSAGFLVHAFMMPRLKLSKPVTVLAIGTMTGMAVTAIVALINWTALGFVPALSDLPEFLLNVFAISLVVAVVFQVASDHRTTPPAAAPPPALLDRLPFDKRGALMAISVEDHYVRIRTTRGEDMVLLRLSDAMREVGETPGWQVHRSHWVAKAAIKSARLEADRAILTLHDDAEIPVSRRYVTTLKDAGVLPK